MIAFHSLSNKKQSCDKQVYITVNCSILNQFFMDKSMKQAVFELWGSEIKSSYKFNSIFAFVWEFKG